MAAWEQCSGGFLGPSLAAVCPGSQFVTFMTIVDMVIRSKDEVAELCNRVEPACPSHNTEYDFIVVGGGTAGAVVASRLSENPDWSVLLLEAGPDEPPGTDVPSMATMFLGTEIDWQYRTEDEPCACRSTNDSCAWPRGKNLGGTSVHNGMMYIRGHAKDFDDWAIPGWSWDEVLPYFMKSENNGEIDRVGEECHNVGGLLDVQRFPWSPPIADSILQAAEELGYGRTEDLNGESITGFTIAQTMSKNGVRVSTARAFLRPFRNRENLDVALNATATRIIIDDDRAIGVEYVQDGEKKVALSSCEVVVSGGAVDSPKLLLLSGIGPTEDLDLLDIEVVKDLPGVGRNLHNHVAYKLPFTINRENYNDLNDKSLDDYNNSLNGPMSATGLAQLTGILSSQYTSPDHPDLQFYFLGYSARCATSGELRYDGDVRTIHAIATNLRPHSRGFLHLRSNDPMDKPMITGNYLTDDRDADVLIEGIKHVRSLMDSEAMRPFEPTLTMTDFPDCPPDPESDDYWDCVIRQNTGPENHQAGSCKMGPSTDYSAVVDPRLRVHGIQGLRVADTSIMPQVTSGNTAAPAIMIGERAADFIKEDHGWNNEDFANSQGNEREFDTYGQSEYY